MFASTTTWCPLVQGEKLRVPRERVYPRPPRLGIRAASPCQIWHVDLTILRLQDGTTAFIQAIIDNASRYVLAFHVADGYGGLRTKTLLKRALTVANRAGDLFKPNVLCDSGTENLNALVDSLIEAESIERTVAQVDIAQSNSMIEALFRQLKHRWLFTNPLPDLATARRLTTAYVRDHNELMPHYAHAGATPMEVFNRAWSEQDRLLLQRATQSAHLKRATESRATACGHCTPTAIVTPARHWTHVRGAHSQMLA